MEATLRKTLQKVSEFYDKNKVGDIGPLGFRRSSDLLRLTTCLETLLERGFLRPGASLFLDMGCADGRVNVLMSYLLRKSIGIELDEWTLEEYRPLSEELKTILNRNNLHLPPENIYLFHGNAMDEDLYPLIYSKTGVDIKDFDLFYTYLTMHREFAELIIRRAKKGAILMIYGLERIMPDLEGFELLTPDGSIENILALYQKR